MQARVYDLHAIGDKKRKALGKSAFKTDKKLVFGGAITFCLSP